MEHLAAVDRSRLFVAVIAIAIFVTGRTERIFHITAGAQISPAQAERKIEWPPGFAGDKIFRIEQPRTADIPRTNRHLRQPVTLFPQTQFEIEGFIFIRLIARERFDAAVLPGAHVGVAQRCFQPREELH